MGLYLLVTPGTPPVTVAEAKLYLKVEDSTDDDLISRLIVAATYAAENYTRRDFRVNAWTLTLDEFCDRIELRRDPVASVSQITRLVAGSPVVVSAAVYYLKKGVQTSEILLNENQNWPTDQDPREAAIVVSFTTQVQARYVDLARVAILRIVAYMYENRGDCGDLSAVGFGVIVSTDIIRGSGAHTLLDQIRVSRV